MKAKQKAIVGTSALSIALIVSACGGSGTDQGCATLDPTRNSNLPACPASTTTPGTTASIPLFTTAPSIITMASGGSATYTIGGGTAPYTVTTGNGSVATASAEGSSMSIKSVAAGSVPIAVVDAVGKSVTINLTVLEKGQIGSPPSIFPASINAGDCTTNIPFVFTGGTAPFTVFTSDNVGVPVSAPQPYGTDSFFLASIRNPGGTFPYTATLTVLDSQSRTAVTHVTVDFPRTCQTNALLQTNPSSANAHLTETLTFQITGSAGPYSVASNNPAIATAVIGPNGTSLNVSAVAAGTALITVKGIDNQQSNIVFTVLPP